MDYMGSCLNEKNIILEVITGKRETTESLCSTCESVSCESNGTAISKADYNERLKTDMIATLDKISAEIEEHVKINQNLNTDRARALCWCLDVIDKYKVESEKPKRI